MVQFTINSFSNGLTGLVQRKDQKSIQFRERHGKGL